MLTIIAKPPQEKCSDAETLDLVELWLMEGKERQLRSLNVGQPLWHDTHCLNTQLELKYLYRTLK